MVKPPSFDSNGMKKGAWSQEEDDRLRAFVHEFGHTNWRLLPKLAGLARCGKSCRLRWVNYLKPGLKRGKFTKHEEELIIKLHHQLGNRWSAIAVEIPGRTDNEIKNYWHAHINKRGRRRPPMPPHVSPSPSESENHDFNSTHHDQEESIEETTMKNTLNPNIADLYSFAPAAQDCILSHVDMPPFSVEEFRDFQLFQQMQNDSDGGSSFCSPTSGEFIGNFWSESFGEDVFDILQLW